MSVFHEAFTGLLAGRSLDQDLALAAFGEMFDGKVPDALAAGFLVALRIKGENADELAGAARVMLARARPAGLGNREILDTAGTGGDGSNSFNVSTGAAIVAAAAGVKVAKHGNRAISGRIGAADLLEGYGIKIDLDRVGLSRCLERAGICFVFAPAFHPAMKRFAELRRILGVRTIFNLLGPLSNPARPAVRLVGVPDQVFLEPMAQALTTLGVAHAMVVHGRDGLDEISVAAPTSVIEVGVNDRGMIRSELKPEDFGIRRWHSGAIAVDGLEEALETLSAALSGAPGAAFDALALNGGAAIYLGGRAASLGQGVGMARATLRDKRGLDTIARLREASQGGP